MTQIIRCRIENILGINEAEFAPNGKSVTIGGANGQGKSSAIWALIMALGGKKFIPEMPVHNGADKGAVVVELDRFTVSLTVNSERESKLKIESKDGARYASPQSMLDEIFGNLTFDPGSFMKISKEERLRCLQQVVKIDTTPLDQEELRLTEDRRITGRTLKELEGKLVGREFDSSIPEAEISSEDILAELKSAQAVNLERSMIFSEIKACESTIGLCARQYASKQHELQKIQQELAKLDEDRNTYGKMLAVLQSRFGARPEIDCDPIHAKLKNVEATNRTIRANLETKRLMSGARNVRSSYDQFTSQLSELSTKRKQLLSAATFPLEGLSFEGDTITFGGVPFEQISESQQWEVSTAIGFAINKKGILFMRNSGGLDRRSRERIRERAAALGVQLFLEVVDDADDVQVLIEDGGIKENRLDNFPILEMPERQKEL